MKNEEYRKIIIEIVKSTNDEKLLICVYTFVKHLLK